MPDTPPKLIRFPALTASALAAITTAILGSFLGTAGTLAGAGLASAIGGIATALYERGIERAHAIARGKRPVTPQARERLKQIATRKVVVRSIAGGVAIGAVTLTVITATEYAAGRPVSAIVQGKQGTGLTLTGGGGNAPQPAPSATSTAPVTAPAYTSPAPATATAATPTGTAATATPTATPTATLTPTATPTGTPTGGPTPQVVPSMPATPAPASPEGTP